MLYKTPKEDLEPEPAFNRHPKELEAAIVVFSMIMICVICWSIL